MRFKTFSYPWGGTKGLTVAVYMKLRPLAFIDIDIMVYNRGRLLRIEWGPR